MDPVIQSLLVIGSALVGLPALITVVINILKAINIVKDGDAQKWSLVLNLVGIYALMTWKVLDPTANIQVADESIAAIAKLIGVFAQLFIQTKVSGAFQNTIRGIPIVGKSYSDEKA